MHKFIDLIWTLAGNHGHLSEPLATAIYAGAALLVSTLVYLLCLKVLAPLVRKVVVMTKVKWDDVVFDSRLLKSVSLVIYAILLKDLLPPSCHLYTWLVVLTGRLTQIFLVIAIVRFTNRVFDSCYALLATDPRIKMQPLKGLLQMLKLIAIVIGAIICISIFIEKNPTFILTSLGASAAVLMLVFKDPILGVVAGVQLSANDMLRKGDWIVVPGTPVDGIVQDVTLTTVKVLNYDNTMLTVPPYNLVSATFQNWRSMKESGARRIMRSVIIDFSSIRFLSSDEVDSLKTQPWFAKVTDHIDTRIVNLTAFRYYLEDFLSSTQLTNHTSLFMVRQLQPTGQGVPLQIYCFASTTVWKDYEHIQADIFDHIYASIGLFGLRLYQAPAADDLLSLRTSAPADDIPAAKS